MQVQRVRKGIPSSTRRLRKVVAGLEIKLFLKVLGVLAPVFCEL